MKNKTISFLIGFFILMTFAITANGETTSSEISNPERVISLFIIMSVGMIITMFISLLYYLEKGYSAIMMIISMIFIIILVFSFDYVFDHFVVWDEGYIYADSGLEEILLMGLGSALFLSFVCFLVLIFGRYLKTDS